VTTEITALRAELDAVKRENQLKEIEDLKKQVADLKQPRVQASKPVQRSATPPAQKKIYKNSGGYNKVHCLSDACNARPWDGEKGGQMGDWLVKNKHQPDGTHCAYHLRSMREKSMREAAKDAAPADMPVLWCQFCRERVHTGQCKIPHTPIPTPSVVVGAKDAFPAPVDSVRIRVAESAFVPITVQEVITAATAALPNCGTSADAVAPRT
jgi:hypothetical protein